MAFFTTILAGIISVVFNLIFIRTLGLYAAALATCLSFFVLWMIRMYSTRSYFRISINKYSFLVNVSCVVGIALSNFLHAYIQWPLKLILFSLMVINNKCLIIMVIKKFYNYIIAQITKKRGYQKNLIISMVMRFPMHIISYWIVLKLGEELA